MKLGFIGCGNMGGAILGGIIGQSFEKAENIKVFDLAKAHLNELCEKFGTIAAESAEEAAKSDVVFLCVKPNALKGVSESIKGSIGGETVVVSIAAGVKLETLGEMLGKDKKIVRIMPNIPALYGEGMSAVCANCNVTSEEEQYILNAFSSFGRAEKIDEKLMDTVTAVSGSSPAMIFMLIEAMADSAVQGGMARRQAYIFAAQTVLGSAKMALESLGGGVLPAELKDMVCSPGGTTIDAVAALENFGFRGSIIEALRVCREKSESMSKK